MITLRHLAAAPALCLALAMPCFAADTPASAPRTSIPFKHEKESDGSLGFQAMAALLLAALAAYGIVFALKHYGVKGAAKGIVLRQRRVRLVESTRLGRRSVLHVVEYEGEQLLLAETEQKLDVLSRRPAVPPAGAADA